MCLLAIFIGGQGNLNNNFTARKDASSNLEKCVKKYKKVKYRLGELSTFYSVMSRNILYKLLCAFSFCFLCVISEILCPTIRFCLMLVCKVNRVETCLD